MEEIESSNKSGPTAAHETIPKSQHTKTTVISPSDDDAIIPKGQIDPVFEAKAKVLNHAVCFPQFYRI